MYLNLSENNHRPQTRFPVTVFSVWFVVAWIGLGSIAGSATELGLLDELPKPLSNSDFRAVSPEKVKLGRLLFYDKILSGNRNIACSTCHHHDHASTDGLSLPVGEGGVGLGPKRHVGTGKEMVEQRVPRNSQALFNIGAVQFTHMFHDGRVFADPDDPTGFNTPAEEDLPVGLDNVVAAQAMFPVTSAVEMAGEFGENNVANAANRGPEYVWPILALRLQGFSEYVDLFKKAYPDIKKASDITMVHAANAIAQFEMSEWRADQSPFDKYLRGNTKAMSKVQIMGMKLFYGEAGCSICHSGVLQTDHQFYAIAMPQIGLIRTRMFDPIVRDRGRINETDRLEDQYRFRTPSLRNIGETGPYGHSGAYRTLEAIVRHHLKPVESLRNFDPTQVLLPTHPILSPLDFIVMDNRREMSGLIAANELENRHLSPDDLERLISFLDALTDKTSLLGRLGPPATVPSRIPVD